MDARHALLPITVVDPFFFTRAPILFEEAREAASNLLEVAAEKFRGAAWETETNVVMGNPRRAISRFAEEWHADLVLVGSHGLNALERLALGSTVRSVLLTMREGRVRRLPVIDSEGKAVGVLSMDDVLLHAEPSGSGKIVELSTDEVVRSFRAINQRELPQVAKKQTVAA